MTEKKPFYFEEIDEGKVSPEILEKARRVLEYCRKRLELNPVGIQWVVQTPAFWGSLDHLEFKLKRLAGDSSGEKPKTERDPDGGFFGQASSKHPERIQVRADIPPREILLTIAHECDHLSFYQIYRSPWTAEEKQAWDKHAEDFAVRVLKEIGE
ncbi:MAG: hypothetical protein Q8O91_05650 [Candidatus Aminicenantes bacterium]|nr:hypothetical protein [Candidatus Aminicenantes bacterium]